MVEYRFWAERQYGELVLVLRVAEPQVGGPAELVLQTIDARVTAVSPEGVPLTSALVRGAEARSLAEEAADSLGVRLADVRVLLDGSGEARSVVFRAIGRRALYRFTLDLERREPVLMGALAFIPAVRPLYLHVLGFIFERGASVKLVNTSNVPAIIVSPSLSVAIEGLPYESVADLLDMVEGELGQVFLGVDAALSMGAHTGLYGASFGPLPLLYLLLHFGFEAPVKHPSLVFHDSLHNLLALPLETLPPYELGRLAMLPLVSDEDTAVDIVLTSLARALGEIIDPDRMDVDTLREVLAELAERNAVIAELRGEPAVEHAEWTVYRVLSRLDEREYTASSMAELVRYVVGILGRLSVTHAIVKPGDDGTALVYLAEEGREGLLHPPVLGGGGPTTANVDLYIVSQAAIRRVQALGVEPPFERVKLRGVHLGGPIAVSALGEIHRVEEVEACCSITAYRLAGPAKVEDGVETADYSLDEDF